MGELLSPSRKNPGLDVGVFSLWRSIVKAIHTMLQALFGFFMGNVMQHGYEFIETNLLLA